MGFVTRQNIILPIDQHPKPCICKGGGSPARSYHLPSCTHMHPTDFLVTRSGIKIFQSGSAQAGDNCDVGVVSRVIAQIFSEHCHSTISVLESTGSFGLIADPGPSIGCMDKDCILKSYGTFHTFRDKDGRIPIMCLFRAEVCSIGACRHVTHVKIKQSLALKIQFHWETIEWVCPCSA